MDGGPIKSVGNEVTVNSSIVVKKLFPHVKFVCNPVSKLSYTDDIKSICNVVRSVALHQIMYLRENGGILLENGLDDR